MLDSPKSATLAVTIIPVGLTGGAATPGELLGIDEAPFDRHVLQGAYRQCLKDARAKSGASRSVVSRIRKAKDALMQDLARRGKRAAGGQSLAAKGRLQRTTISNTDSLRSRLGYLLAVLGLTPLVACATLWWTRHQKQHGVRTPSRMPERQVVAMPSLSLLPQAPPPRLPPPPSRLFSHPHPCHHHLRRLHLRHRFR